MRCAIALVLAVLLPMSVVDAAIRTVTPAPAAGSPSGGGRPAAGGARVVVASSAVPAHTSHRRHHHLRVPTPDVSGDDHPQLDWVALAECESGGHWHEATGNGYYGGVQFDVTTWRSVGGVGLPSDATRAVQLHYARVLFADRGRDPWPVCGALL